MATSGTYVTEVPLKGNAEKHYRRWWNENHVFPDAIGHHIQGVTIHDGEWDSHGGHQDLELHMRPIQPLYDTIRF
ncbi:hypothetical protein DY000_02038068 [Brassica cretica]|uniref:Bet v I/Major latex protein domain-containing protein n=1 Tax=Brassica cretica TaxID=69181 RepID=A0ABQ7BID3_BRACR|nr:hypothetical protein DY000_02038068 [Brassica cretica]